MDTHSFERLVAGFVGFMVGFMDTHHLHATAQVGRSRQPKRETETRTPTVVLDDCLLLANAE